MHMEAHTMRSAWMVSLLALSTCGIVRYAAAFGLGESGYASLWRCSYLQSVRSEGALRRKCTICLFKTGCVPLTRNSRR